MGIRHVLLIGVVILGVCLSSVNAHHDQDESYMDVIRHKFSSLWPWGHNLGHDWTDTQNKVDDIYRRSHDQAKNRVEELKEDALKDTEVQKKIADIYQEEALKAEKEIEALKHPLMDKLTSWTRTHGREPSHEEKKTILEKLGWSKHKPDEVLPYHLYEETTKKIGETYRSALDQAKAKLGDVSDKVSDVSGKVSDKVGDAGSAATHGWHATKKRASQAYSDAFHKGHFESRSKFGQFRDLMSRGARGFGFGGKSLARKTIEWVWSIVSSLVLLALGGAATLYAMRLWNHRQLMKQMHANVAGPVQACGEYYVVGGEAEQKKFYDFWSGTGYSYFSRQPGLKKYWMHRGVPGAENNWMSYSEWASIDDLRRACSTTEFQELKKKSPGFPARQMHVYQLAASGNNASSRVEAEGTKDGGLRQRTTTTTTSST